ncbi:hypothetical protein NW765_003780 [Fusarium oxysporum]|nr:hypothetical protein NW765_003780 [Fusarium oxysporum]
MLVVHDAKIETRRLEAIIESTCEGPREKRPKYKDLAPPAAAQEFCPLSSSLCSEIPSVAKGSLDPFPLLPPSSNPSITRINLYNIQLQASRTCFEPVNHYYAISQKDISIRNETE